MIAAGMVREAPVVQGAGQIVALRALLVCVKGSVGLNAGGEPRRALKEVAMPIQPLRERTVEYRSLRKQGKHRVEVCGAFGMFQRRLARSHVDQGVGLSCRQGQRREPAGCRQQVCPPGVVVFVSELLGEEFLVYRVHHRLARRGVEVNQTPLGQLDQLLAHPSFRNALPTIQLFGFANGGKVHEHVDRNRDLATGNPPQERAPVLVLLGKLSQEVEEALMGSVRGGQLTIEFHARPVRYVAPVCL